MTSLLRRPGGYWAGCLLLVLLASLFGRTDIPIDETRYVSVAWEMWSGGDWLVMHKNGQPYHHKPPLLFWLIGLGWGVFGVNDWWPRSIAAIASFACLLLTAAIARRLWPDKEGVGERAGWLLLGNSFWLLFGAAVMFDILLAVFALLAVLAALRAWQGERRGTWGLFGVAIGFGILAKGPVVLLLVLPVLLAAPWWGGRGRFGRAWYGGIGLGVLLGAAIALAWAIPAAILGGEEFRNAIFWGQTAGRVSGSLAHKKPFWYYLALSPLLLFPWFFRGDAWRAVGATLRNRADAGARFCLAWAVLVFLGFSLAGGKQAHYLLPLLPVCSLLIAYGWTPSVRAGAWAGLPLAAALLLAGGGLVLAPVWAGKLGLEALDLGGWRIAGTVLVLLAPASYLAGRGVGAQPRLAAVSVGLVAALLALFFRPLAPAFDTTPLAVRLKALETEGVPVAHVGTYHDQYQFYGQLQRPLQELAPGAGITGWLADHPGGRVVAYLAKYSEVEALRPEFAQPYLRGAAVLLDADSARRLAGGGQDE